MRKVGKTRVLLATNDNIEVKCEFDHEDFKIEYADEIHYRKTSSSAGTGYGGEKEEFWAICPMCRRVLNIKDVDWSKARKYKDHFTVIPEDLHG